MRPMTFKQEFVTALKQGLDPQALVNLALARHSDPQKAYEALEDIWRELGFDTKEGAPGQDDLEYVMEKLWYSSPARDSTK